MIKDASTAISLLGQADVLLLLADFLRSPAMIRPFSLCVDDGDLVQLIESTGMQNTGEILSALRQCLKLASETTKSDWSDEYHRLCEGAMPVPLNETAYIRRDKGALIGDLAGFYKAFGWQATTTSGEKQDHLITELEFVAMLLVMCARALTDRNPDHVEVTARAMDLFAGAHLGDWLPSVCARIQQFTHLPILASAAGALFVFWNALVAHHGWSITQVEQLIPRTEPEEAYECGAEGQAPVQVNIG